MICYTAIFGRYDTLREPLVPQSPNVRFVCLTDQPPLRIGWRPGSVWELIPLRNLPLADPLWSARWQKLHPPHGESVWIDSSLGLQVDLLEAVRQVDRPMVCLPYLRRNCIYSEKIAACRRVKGQDRAELVSRIEAQVEHYREIGLPSENGLHLTGLLYRDGSEAVRQFSRLWWAEMRRWGSPRDQVALAKVEWETGFQIASWPRGMVRQYPHTYEQAPPGRLRSDGSIKTNAF